MAMIHLWEMRKGFLFILVGIALFLHTLGIIPIGSNVFLIGLSLYLIVIGLMKTGYYNKIVAMISKGGSNASSSEFR